MDHLEQVAKSLATLQHQHSTELLEPLYRVVAEKEVYRLRGMALSKGDKGFLLTGPKHSGKSPLSEHFAIDGAKVMSYGNSFVFRKGSDFHIVPGNWPELRIQVERETETKPLSFIVGISSGDEISFEDLSQQHLIENALGNYEPKPQQQAGDILVHKFEQIPSLHFQRKHIGKSDEGMAFNNVYKALYQELVRREWLPV
tara:strand:+ start:97 stop:696 length:600 start_codon:yes stop_codon:yes gene_type:complete